MLEELQQGRKITKESIEVCADLLRDYPVVWWSYTVLSDRAFNIMSPYLDRHYFEVAELDV